MRFDIKLPRFRVASLGFTDACEHSASGLGLVQRLLENPWSLPLRHRGCARFETSTPKP